MDEKLRSLALRWKQTGAAADGAAYVKGSLRAGTTTPGRVAAAAFLGCEASRVALGTKGPKRLGDDPAWIEELDDEPFDVWDGWFAALHDLEPTAAERREGEAGHVAPGPARPHRRGREADPLAAVARSRAAIA